MRGNEGAAWPDPEVGLIPRALAQLLSERERLRRDSGVEITLTASYVQIYCEMLQVRRSDGHTPRALARAPAPAPTRLSACSRHRSAHEGSKETHTRPPMRQDLLEPTNSNMSIRERADGQVYVEGLSRIPVTSLNQCLDLLRDGDANRAVAATNMNATSSRSHAAFIVRSPPLS